MSLLADKKTNSIFFLVSYVVPKFKHSLQIIFKTIKSPSKDRQFFFYLLGHSRQCTLVSKLQGFRTKPVYSFYPDARGNFKQTLPFWSLSDSGQLVCILSLHLSKSPVSYPWVSAYKNSPFGEISVKIKCLGLPLRLMLAFYRTPFLMLSERTHLPHPRIPRPHSGLNTSNLLSSLAEYRRWILPRFPLNRWKLMKPRE